ncbi:hypothetical protein XA68_15074 [Ophiocordyceps unilateralis]|uniref:N-alpha-acetyltransferase 40 n=1 Tax=Ophiocordyceps unilateralis TaxID=268505 RepID=A0A2A9PMJ4_OPHUN|nr:hypothetical protein XA68_15074 [Ophiocordyceps unilateralis]
MMALTSTQEATKALETAKLATDEEFLQRYVQPRPDSWPSWTHPRSGAQYRLRLVGTAALRATELEACLRLVCETSGDAYRASATGWRPVAKRREMTTSGMRYLLVEDEQGRLMGFVSLLPTWEGGRPVVYCYEIHLDAALRGTGLGTLLMGYVAAAAERIERVEKVMLTCFTSNKRGLDFYTRLGYAPDASSPQERTLRGGRVVVPDYVILSRPTANNLVRTRLLKDDDDDDDDDGP